MKKLFVLIAVFIFSSILLTSQEGESDVWKFLKKRGYVQKAQSARAKEFKHTISPDTVFYEYSNSIWPDTVFYNTRYTASLLGSPTIPITFSRIEIKDKEYKMGPAMSLGFGYTWFVGEFLFDLNDKIVIDPQFFFGAGADIGVKNDFNTGKAALSAVCGGFIGIKVASLFGGYDFLSKSWSIGLGTRIDLITISQLNLKPIGKVYSVKKPKNGAMPVDLNK